VDKVFKETCKSKHERLRTDNQLNLAPRTLNNAKDSLQKFKD